jgi:hypothetical protein
MDPENISTFYIKVTTLVVEISKINLIDNSKITNHGKREGRQSKECKESSY